MGSAPEAHQPLAENPTLSVIFFALQKIVLNILSMSNVKKRHMVAMNIGCNSKLLISRKENSKSYPLRNIFCFAKNSFEHSIYVECKEEAYGSHECRL